MIRILCIVVMLSMTSPHAIADLSLPENLPDVTTTESSSLGTLDGGHGLTPGTRVASFTVKDHFEKPVQFEELAATGPLLVVFYRGGWCPYCNRQIRSLTKAWPEFEKRKVVPVLISADKPDAAAIAQRSYEIPFPVLSDPELVAHQAFNVSMKVPGELIPVYREYGIVLEDWSGKEHHTIAVSSVFLVDQNSTVKWSHSSLDYKTRPSVEQLLAAIDSLE